MKHGILATVAACGMAAAGAASAVTVEIKLTEFGSVGAAIHAQNGFIAHELAYEDFEGFCSYEDRDTNRCDGGYDTASLAENQGGPSGGQLFTNVGNIRSLPGTGTGDSNVAPDDHAIVRSAAGMPGVFGRFDADGDRFGATDYNNYLDSNDNGGIRLNIPGASGIDMFNQLSFILTDIDDVGKIGFAIEAGPNFGGSPFSDIFMNDSKEGNGNIFLATLMFSEMVSDITVDMTIDEVDGFGLDSISASVVPLPAAGWMLLAGVGALGVASRRKRKTS